MILIVKDMVKAYEDVPSIVEVMRILEEAEVLDERTGVRQAL